MREIEVFPMEKRHIPQLAEIERLCFSEPWSEAALAEELENPFALFYTAKLEGKIAGYAGMHAVAGEGYLCNVAVSPNCRRRGIARALMEKLVQDARRLSLALLTLEVRQGNQPAILLYTGFGFQVEGRRRGFYRNPTEDALIMTRREEER